MAASTDSTLQQVARTLDWGNTCITVVHSPSKVHVKYLTFVTVAQFRGENSTCSLRGQFTGTQ